MMIELSSIKRDIFGKYQINMVIFDDKNTEKISKIQLYINNIMIFDNTDYVGNEEKAFITPEQLEFIGNIELWKIIKPNQEKVKIENKVAYIQFFSYTKEKKLMAIPENWEKEKLMQFLGKLPKQRTGEIPEKIDPEQAVKIMSAFNNILELKSKEEIKKLNENNDHKIIESKNKTEKQLKLIDFIL